MPYFSFSLTNEEFFLLTLAGLCIMAVCIIYLTRIRKAAKYAVQASLPHDVTGLRGEPVSVIVYSQDDPENLEHMLRSLLAQDYGAPYEVIVVNEGESSDIRDVVGMLRVAHPNLYLTSTPDGVRNLSRKKLGITLGVKAARYGIVALTTTAVDIPSPHWLSALMRNFSPDSPTGVVLGFAAISPEEDTARGKRRRAFDFVAESVRWLSAAIAGRPFRGVEYNLAYRKELFLKNSGFAHSLNLHYGDDDIFVSEIANGSNTAVELSPESFVYLRGGNSPRLFRERMARRCFTESFIRHRPHLTTPCTAGWLQLAALAAGTAAAVLSWPNIVPALIAAILMLAIWIADTLVWRAAMAALRSRRLCITLPWLSMTHPLRKACHIMRSRLGKQRKYTWD